MLRSQLFANPQGRFLHDIVLGSCEQYPHKIAIIDSSCDRRITYSEYGDLVRTIAGGLVAAGLKPGEVVAIYLPNCWEFCAVPVRAMSASVASAPMMMVRCFSMVPSLAAHPTATRVTEPLMGRVRPVAGRRQRLKKGAQIVGFLRG